MKKILLAVLAVAILIAYALATYGFGMRAESTAKAWVDALPNSVPYLKVTRNDYQRGFLKSTHNVELQASLPGMDAPLAVTLQDEVAHGPFPGFNSFGVARVTHTLVLPTKVQEALTKVLGDKPPLTAVTMLNFGGGGSTHVTSPAFTYKDERGEASWQGIEANIDFSKGYEHVGYTLAAPGFDAKMLDGSQFQIGKIDAAGQQDKMAGTESLYLGKSNLTMQSLTAAKGPAATLSLTNIAYAAEAKSSAPTFVDVGGKLSAQNLKVAGEDWGALEYAFNAKHLHAPSVDAFAKAMREVYGASARSPQSLPPAQATAQMQAAMLDVFKKHGGALLKNEPVIELEKLRFGNEREYLSLNADARFAGVTDADVANPMQLIPKINARAEIVLAEAMLTRLAGKVPATMGRPGSAGNSGDPAAATAAPGNDTLLMINAQVDNAVAQGYVIRGNGTLRSTITFTAGKLSVNGRAVDGPP